MRALVRLWPLALVGGIASCAFLLDYDELQSGADDAGADVSSGGGQAGSGGAGTGGTAASGGSAGSGGTSTGGQSGTGGDAASDAPTGIPLGQLAAELAKAGCDNATACYGPAIEIATKGADCVQWVTATIEDVFVGAIQASVDAGMVAYDPVKGAQCIAELKANTTDAGLKCVDLAKLFEFCKGALSGLADGAGSCSSTVQCGIGLFCDTSTCPGECKPYLGPGSPCASSAQCKVGHTCFVAAAAAADAGPDAGQPAGTCQPYTSANATCEVGKTPECEPGTYCIEKSCKPTIGLFTTANSYACYSTGILCAPGLACQFDMPGIPFVASAHCVPDQAHSPCNIALPDGCGQGSYCTAGFFGANGQCVKLPDADQQCANNYAQWIGLASQCSPGNVCVDGLCKKAARLGESCISSAQCVSGHCLGATDAGPGTCGASACE